MPADGKNTGRRLLRIILSAAFWLLIWQLVSNRVGIELLIPSPFSVFKTLAGLFAEADFWLSAGLTLARILAGFSLGVIMGAAFGVLTFFFKTFDTIMSPMLRVIRATPVASFIILALLFFGRASVPVVISMLMVMPVVWQSVGTGLLGADAGLLEMSRAYRFTALQRLGSIYIPSALPSLYSGCVTSMGLAWKSGVAAEVLCQPSSAIGTELYYSKIYLETPRLFAWTIVVVILSLLLEKLMAGLFEKLRRGRS